jgi:hypothetical protein
LNQLFPKFKNDTNFLLTYLRKLSNSDPRKAKQFMRKTKIPLEIVLQVSKESNFDEITVLS